jgi:hypothetical protein
MTPQRLLNTGIIPALEELSTHGIPDSVDARRFLLAIALQETRLEYRRQVVKTAAGLVEEGPASSFWQFEQGGGCKGVVEHGSTCARMAKICTAYNVQNTPRGLWDAMRYNDVVAAAAARLLVYTLPGKLPTTAADGWAQYLRAWRPGKPHPATWGAHWDNATIATGAKP